MLITDELPDNFVGSSVLILFSVNLIFSFPLVLYPAHKIIEIYLYDGWEKSKKRQMCKNTNRTMLVGLVIVITILLGDKLDKFLSVLGALTCTPIAFSFPTIFHYKACGDTWGVRVKDLSLFMLSMVMMVFCSIQSISNWNSD